MCHALHVYSVPHTHTWLFPIKYVPSARARSQTNRIEHSGLQLSDNLGLSEVVAGGHVSAFHLGIAKVVAGLRVLTVRVASASQW